MIKLEAGEKESIILERPRVYDERKQEDKSISDWPKKWRGGRGGDFPDKKRAKTLKWEVTVFENKEGNEEWEELLFEEPATVAQRGMR